MQRWMAGFVALSLLVTLVPGVTATDTDTGQIHYHLSAGVRVNHGIIGVIPDDRNGVATSACLGETNIVAQLVGGGCIGGGIIRPSQWTVDNQILYRRMSMTIIDVVSGPNVYSSVCNYHPLSGSWCDHAVLDQGYDAFQWGCGLTLVADAEGIEGHTGDDRAVAFTHNLWVDPYTSEVCLGTNGDLVILFDKANHDV